MILGEGVEYGQETGPSWTLSCVISYWQVKRGLWVKWESKRLGKRKAFVFLLLNFMWLLRNKDFQTLYFGYYILSYQAFKDFYIEPLYDRSLLFKVIKVTLPHARLPIKHMALNNSNSFQDNGVVVFLKYLQKYFSEKRYYRIFPFWCPTVWQAQHVHNHNSMPLFTHTQSNSPHTFVSLCISLPFRPEDCGVIFSLASPSLHIQLVIKFSLYMSKLSLSQAGIPQSHLLRPHWFLSLPIHNALFRFLHEYNSLDT